MFTLQKFIFDASNKIEFQLPNGFCPPSSSAYGAVNKPRCFHTGSEEVQMWCVKKSVPNYVPCNLCWLIWQEPPLLFPTGSPANKKHLTVQVWTALRWKQFGNVWWVLAKFSLAVIPLKQLSLHLFVWILGQAAHFHGHENYTQTFALRRGNCCKDWKRSHWYMLDRKLDLPPK